jgi:hypothetical protein
MAYILNIDQPKEILKEGIMKKILFSFLVLALMSFMVGTAVAGFVESANVREINVSPGQGVTFTGVNGAPSGTWLTGVYNFQIESGTFAGTYGGFCVDPAGSNTSYSLYDINTVDAGTHYAVAAWLLNQYYTVAGTSAVATQAAIWEIMFENGSGNSLSTGNFRTTNAIASLADSYLALALANYGSLNLDGFYLAQSPASGPPFFNEPYQDYIFRVAEPGTLLLMGLGLIGLAGLRRKE